MTLRDSQLTGRLRLRHQQEHTEARGEEMDEERARFQRLAREDSAPRVVSSFNLFQSPEPLAARLAELLQPTGRILEPSAGLGRLYRAVRAIAPDVPITLVEIAPDCCRELYLQTEADPAATLVQGDFLAIDAGRLGTFDRIVANPPFKLGRDIRHIRRMLDLLAPGGRLVSLCAAGPRQREQLAPLGQWIDLPPGSFTSEGTGVNAAILVIERG